MAQQKIRDRQDTLSPLVQGTNVHGGRVSNPAPDLYEFKITMLEAESFSEIESLSLSGTNLPFHPLTHGVSQEVVKFYYPGGPAERKPTVHVMGSMEEDVTLTGRFKSTKIGDPSRRDEPLIISRTLERFTKQGNMCRFQIGSWIKFGYIVRFEPSYKTNSDIDWMMQLTIVSDESPDLETDQKIFEQVQSSVDPSESIQNIEIEFNATRKAVESTGYLEPIPVEELARIAIADITEEELQNLSQDQIDTALNSIYPLRRYIMRVRDFIPQGRFFDFGRMLLTSYQEYTGLIEEYLDEVELYAEDLNRTTVQVNRFFLTIESIRSQLYNTADQLFVEAQTVSAGFDTFSRMEILNTVNNAIRSMYNTILEMNNSSQQALLNITEDVEDIYVVREGDTLQGLSTVFYGDFNRWTDIKNANELTSNDIQKDQQLIIPR